MKISELQTRSNAVLCSYPFEGRHEGKFLGVPGSGLPVRLPCVAAYGFSGGLISTIDVKVDMARMRRYLMEAMRFHAGRDTAA